MKFKNIIFSIILSTLFMSACNTSKQPTVVVPELIDGIRIDSKTIYLDVDETKDISFLLQDGLNQDVLSWISSDESIVRVEGNSIKGLKKGETLVSPSYPNRTFKEYVLARVRDPKSLWDESQDDLRKGLKSIDFYNLNDFHGSVEYVPGSKEPGINYLSTYITQLMNKNPEGSLITSSGDMWQGSCDSNLTHGGLVADWMNLLGFSAQAIGNHEFDWTIDQIKTNTQKMNFPLLAGNIAYKDTGKTVDWVTPYTTVTRNGVHIGIVGAIGEGLTSSILSGLVKDVTFKDPNSSIKKWSNYLKDNGADIILVLLHDNVEQITLSTVNGRVNAIFGGHEHTKQDQFVGQAPAIQALSNGTAIGHIKIDYDFGSRTVISSSKEVIDSKSSVCVPKGIHVETKELYDRYLVSDELAAKNEVVSTYREGINKDTIPLIYNEYANKYYEEFHKKEDKFVISAITTNNARSYIPSGKEITYADVYKALPFDNALCVMAVNGKNMSKVADYGFWTIANKKPVEKDEIINTFNKDKIYYILTIDYIATNEYKSRYIDVVKIYEEEEALPRNIFKRYLKDYPSNFHY